MTTGDITLRSLDVEADIDVAAALVEGSERQGTGSSDTDRDRVRSDLTSPLALPDDHRLALLDGEPVGLLLLELDPESREVFAQVVAVGEDRMAVLARLVGEAQEFAGRLAAAEPVEPDAEVDPFVLSADFWQFACVALEGDAQMASVLADAGLRHIRSFWRMTMDLSATPDTEPAPPPGVTRRIARDESDRRAVHAIDQAAFAEHFGFLHEDPFERYMELMESRSGYDPDRWWIADLDGTPVGICLLDDSRAGFNEDYVGVLGVVKSARHRGIARWLLECAAVEARARGRSALCLSVDGENTTGATALYDSVGFRTRRRMNLWVQPVAVGR